MHSFTHFEKKVSIKTVKVLLGRKIKSAEISLFFALFVLSVIPVIITSIMMNYCYKEKIINQRISSLQTRAAAIAGDFADYESLTAAEKDGMYNQMIKYSSFEEMRIRIIDNEYIIRSDSYAFENGKIIMNSRVINTFNNRKSYSGIDGTTKVIEAVVPIYGKDGQMLGVFDAVIDGSQIDIFQDDVRKHSDVLVLSMIIFCIGLVYFFSKIFLKHLKKETEMVEEIANGHKDKRLEEKGFTEYKDFAKYFNMIMDSNNTLNESRQEFVSNVSHELKTPITSMKVLADSLNIQEDVPVEIYKEFMHDIVDEIDREAKIIDDLLSIVKLDKPASELNISSFNINEMLEVVLKRLKPLAQKKNIELLFESFRPVVAEVDEIKLTQVISNLVENAIKYNNLDGWVHVSLNADHQYFYVRVEDSGIGIPQESQKKVFERFYRVDKARSRETGGTGLGLAIVKSIVIMHHGTIKLYSEEGKGTNFTIRIPLKYSK